MLPVDETDTVSARRRLRVWSLVCIGGLLLTSAAEVVLRARTMGGGGWAESVRVVPLVLSRTHFGVIWLGRIVALTALVVAVGRGGCRARAVALALASGVAHDFVQRVMCAGEVAIAKNATGAAMHDRCDGRKPTLTDHLIVERIAGELEE